MAPKFAELLILCAVFSRLKKINCVVSFLTETQLKLIQIQQ